MLEPTLKGTGGVWPIWSVLSSAPIPPRNVNNIEGMRSKLQLTTTGSLAEATKGSNKNGITARMRIIKT